jgi:hypothetical protein
MTNVLFGLTPCNSYKLFKRDLFFYPEDEGKMFLRNVGNDLPDYMVFILTIV